MGAPLLLLLLPPSLAPHPSRTRTRAIFYTESDYNPSLQGWVGRISVLRAATPDSPRWVADGTNPTGLAVDSARGRVYWTDPGDASIHTCMADGSGHARVAAGTFGHRENDGPFGIAVDAEAQTLIWSTLGQGTLRRSDLHGNGIGTLPIGESEWTASGPWGIATHLRPDSSAWVPSRRQPPRGRARALGEGATEAPGAVGSVFWTCWGRICSCQLGSTDVRDVVRGLIDPRGIAIDRARRRIFWTDLRTGKVQCANLDGSSVCDVATGLSAPFGIALGPSRVFWTDRVQGAIYSCCLRKGTVSRVLEGLHQPEGIAIYNTVAGVQLEAGRAGGAMSEAERLLTTIDAGGERSRRMIAHNGASRRPSSAKPLGGAMDPGKADRLKRRWVSRGHTAFGNGASSAIPAPDPASAAPSIQEVMQASASALAEMQASGRAASPFDADAHNVMPGDAKLPTTARAGRGARRTRGSGGRGANRGVGRRADASDAPAHGT